MDTLYTLCRSVDNRHAAPLGADEVGEIAAHKRSYFEREADDNPLVRAILDGSPITYFGMEHDDRHGLMQGPPGFFRTHEILRHSRRTNAPLRIGGREYPHNAVAALFARCIPNTKLHYLPWFSLSRYVTSLGLVWGVTFICAHLVARDAAEGNLLDATIVYYLGWGGTVAALATTILLRNRDVRQASPWNSAIYLDLNADLVRRQSPLLAVAREEHLPRQRPFKTPEFYQALLRRIESHAFDEDLKPFLSAQSPVGPKPSTP